MAAIRAAAPNQCICDLSGCPFGRLVNGLLDATCHWGASVDEERGAREPHAGICADCDTKPRSNLLQLEVQPGCNPMFCHWYPTRTCDRSNLVVRSSWDNVTLPGKVAIKPRGALATASANAVGG